MTDLKTRPCRWLFIDQERDQPAFSEHRNAHPSVHSYCSFIAGQRGCTRRVHMSSHISITLLSPVSEAPNHYTQLSVYS